LAAWLGLVFFLMLSPAAGGLQAQEPAAAPQEHAEEHESGTGEAEAHGGWGATIAKAVNVTILIGALVYFLKSPIARHLHTRAAPGRAATG
jgi:hypothetical protein